MGVYCSCLLRSPTNGSRNDSGLFVMELVEDLDIPCIVAGSTTFRRRAKRGGVEGDQTYYLAIWTNPWQEEDRSEERSAPGSGGRGRRDSWSRRGRRGLSPIPRPRGLGLRCGPLIDPGAPARRPVAPSERSRSLPGPRRRRDPFLGRLATRTMNDTAWIKELRRWVVEVLVPRIVP